MLPLIEGTAGERAIDISKLRDQTGLITLDGGYGNTGSCQSAITFMGSLHRTEKIERKARYSDEQCPA
jgi:hypothetical protein